MSASSTATPSISRVTPDALDLAPPPYEDVKSSAGIKLKIVPLRAWMWFKDLKEGDHVNLSYGMSHGNGKETASVCTVYKLASRNVVVEGSVPKIVRILHSELAYTIAEEKSLRAYDEKDAMYRIEKISGAVGEDDMPHDNMDRYDERKPHLSLDLVMV